MAVTFGFYNSLNGDRKYNARDMNTLFDGLINDGIFMSIGDKLMVTAGAGMTVNVGVGRAWFNRTWTYNDSVLPITLDQSEIVLNRIDAIILEVDSSDAVRMNTIKVKKGTPASNPVNPTMTKIAQLNQYPLAYIRVNKLATEITQANITNAVGTTATPFVTGIIQSMNIDALIAQWGTEWNEWNNQKRDDFLQWIVDQQTEYESWTEYRQLAFDSWFLHMKDQLSTDAAGNLQLQIDESREQVDLALSDHQNTVATPTILGHIKAETDLDGALKMPIMKIKVFNIPGVQPWIVPKGVKQVFITAAGGGGGGDGGGGGGGAWCLDKPITVTPEESITVTTAGPGGISSFGSRLSLSGGGKSTSNQGGVGGAGNLANGIIPGISGAPYGAPSLGSGGGSLGAGGPSGAGVHHKPYGQAYYGGGGSNSKSGASGVVIIKWFEKEV